MTTKTVGLLAVEVIADNSGKWCGNAIRFDTLDEAKAYGADLAWRWTLVRDWRVIEVEGGAVLYSTVGDHG